MFKVWALHLLLCNDVNEDLKVQLSVMLLRFLFVESKREVQKRKVKKMLLFVCIEIDFSNVMVVSVTLCVCMCVCVCV